jgi:hypothetical protein
MGKLYGENHQINSEFVIADKLRITNYELRITNYELRITNYELRITNYYLYPSQGVTSSVPLGLNTTWK